MYVSYQQSLSSTVIKFDLVQVVIMVKKKHVANWDYVNNGFEY